MKNLVNCRSCGHKVSREARECPECYEVYPSLSEKEVQRYYSNCVSCNDRLTIDNNFWKNNQNLRIDEIPKNICPQCGQPNPLKGRPFADIVPSMNQSNDTLMIFTAIIASVIGLFLTLYLMWKHVFIG